jgi:branched-chain amino acid transport system substrate-binding protein
VHRRSMRAALVSVATVAAVTLAACGSQTQGGDSTSAASSSAASPAASSPGSASASSGATSEASTAATSTGDLLIRAEFPIDKDGNEVPVPEAGNAAKAAGAGGATCSGISIGMAGALTGANAALGLNILYGANVAIKEHNEANPGCQVEVKQFDTEGDPQKATQVAPQIVGDQSVIGLLGPAFSGETEATGPIFFQAGLLSLTASATRTSLTSNGWTNFFRGLASDAVQGPAVANYLVKGAGYAKVCVVTDDSAYGKGLADEMAPVLGDAVDSSCAAEVKTGDKDFTAAVQLINAAAPDAVFYAGYYAEAAPFVQQLRDAGVTAVFVSADGVNDPQFVEQAGGAAEGAILSCPCGPAPDEYAATYEELNGQAPGVYSVEGYDLTTIMLSGIDSGITDRAALIDYVKNYDGPGLARNYKWNAQGELESSVIWIYKVQ